MTRSALSQAHSRNIDQGVSGFSWVGNSPVLPHKTTATLGTGATTSLATAAVDCTVIGLQARITTAVTGGDSTLQLVVAGVEVGEPLVIPEDSAVGDTVRIMYTETELESIYAMAGETLAVKNDAVASAGVAFLTLVLSPH